MKQPNAGLADWVKHWRIKHYITFINQSDTCSDQLQQLFNDNFDDLCSGKSATHAIVYAQLNMQDGTNHGLHPFFVQIRDPSTQQPLPGVTVGDLGEKIGLNGVDNGFVQFTNYILPRESLLNKMGDVTEDGRYVTPFKDPSKRFGKFNTHCLCPADWTTCGRIDRSVTLILGASLGALSLGRTNITAMCSAYLTVAIVIAIRYSAARKQFGPSNKEEWPVIEYQIQVLLIYVLEQNYSVARHLSDTCRIRKFYNYINT